MRGIISQSRLRCRTASAACRTGYPALAAGILFLVRVSPLFLCLLLPALSIAAAAPSGSVAGEPERLRIGLVLSGGGARGAAHIGVLKVLEQERIPIDAIAGTSIGAVVGGLYASGLSAAEIEAVIGSAEWLAAFRDEPPRSRLSFRRKSEDQNFLVRFPLGLKSGDFRLPRGLVSGQRLQQVLRRLTLPVVAARSFDELPTPFRAVATDLESGEGVVLGDGDLVTAMRASVSAPGVFAPVEHEGRLLVDGGLADNLPVDVARAMGVDRLIVVDVGFPLQARSGLDSVGTISNQMLAILIRRGSDPQRRSLGPQDVLLAPALGEASSFDFGLIPRAVELGEQAAREQLDRLAEFRLEAGAYRRYAAARESARQPPPRIDYVRVAEGSERYQRVLDANFGTLAGTQPDGNELDARVTTLYGRGNLETLEYRFESAGGLDGIALRARRNSWGPNYVRFGLSLQDDFDGNSSYNAAARFVLSEISALGAEWVWDLQVGENPRVASEVYLPLDDRARWFLMPHARFEVRNVPLLEEQRRLAEFRLSSFEYGLDAGRELSNWGEVRAGFRRVTGRSRVRLGDPALEPEDFDVREYFARFSYDGLDDVNFPRRGQSLRAEWRGERRDLGSERSADLLTFDWLAARSRGRDTAVLWTSMGTNVDSEPASVRTLFPLGGFLNLSGLAPDSISGRHFAITRLMYYRQIGRGGEGFLNVPAYAGLSYEIGNVWDNRNDISFGSARRQGSLFLGLDTLLGPVYLGTGFDDEGETAFYLFLGRTF
jgi:NTE family protein